MITCPKCGAANAPEALTCGNCSESLRETPPGPLGEGTGPEPLSRIAPVGVGKEGGGANLRGILSGAITALIVLALAGALVWYFLLRSTPEKTVTQFVDAIRKPDEAAMVELFSADSKVLYRFFKALSPQAFQATQAQIPATTEIKVANIRITGENATAEVSAREAGGPSATAPAPVYLIREQGKWKIDIKRQMVELFRGLAGKAPAQTAMIRQQLASRTASDPEAARVLDDVFKQAIGQ